jgi:tripartite-type tricarboxylate transporter receptor subunit TctC
MKFWRILGHWDWSVRRSSGAPALLRACAAAASVVLATCAAQAQQKSAPADFTGKQIRLFIGFWPTAYGYDTYGRLLARYLGKYLPGNPSVVPEDRPGAGSLSLTSYMAHAAVADGTEIAMVGRGVALEPILDAPISVPKFEATKLTWLGRSPPDVVARAQAIAVAN